MLLIPVDDFDFGNRKVLSMHFQRLYFKNAEGKNLAARLDLPGDEKPACYAIFAHCFTCTKNVNAAVNISRALTREGIAVLRFDFTGIGESEGDFSETNFSTNVSDLVAAAEFLSRDFEPPKLLVGHSLGGAAVLRAAAGIPSTAAVAVIAAPGDLSGPPGVLADTREEILARGQATINLAGKSITLKRQFVEDLERERMDETLRKLEKPLLIMHSPLDNIVSIDNAARIFMAARHSKSFVSLDKADHLLSNRADSLYAGSVLAAWARKYVGISEEPEEQRDLTDNRVIVHSGKTGFQTQIVANGHRLIADEPVAVGGANTGPTPYDYLAASLGACTSMTLRLYADRRRWPLEFVTVRLKHEQVHKEDCENCEGEGRTMDRIDREIQLTGPLDDSQKRKLLEIADKCPVHKTLRAGVTVRSFLKDVSPG